MVTSTIQKQENRIVVPQEAIDAGVIETEKPLFWGYDETEPAAYVSMDRDRLESLGCELVGDTGVMENRVVTIPIQFFPNSQTPPNAPASFGLFTNGATVEWEIVDGRVCRLRPV